MLNSFFVMRAENLEILQRMYGSLTIWHPAVSRFYEHRYFLYICTYRTESLVQYFPRLAFLNFIFNFILSCFFLYLKVYANEAECKQLHHERFA